jgi:hypothetical protein
MRSTHTALVKANGGLISTNELVDRFYPDIRGWQDREKRREAVRKAISALEQQQLEGVRIIREGEGSEERVRADLTKWTGRYIPEPRQRDRRTISPAGKESSASKDDPTAVAEILAPTLPGASDSCPACHWPMSYSYTAKRLVHSHNGADRHAAVGPNGGETQALGPW